MAVTIAGRVLCWPWGFTKAITFKGRNHYSVWFKMHIFLFYKFLFILGDNDSEF